MGSIPIRATTLHKAIFHNHLAKLRLPKHGPVLKPGAKTSGKILVGFPVSVKSRFAFSWRGSGSVRTAGARRADCPTWAQSGGDSDRAQPGLARRDGITQWGSPRSHASTLTPVRSSSCRAARRRDRRAQVETAVARTRPSPRMHLPDGFSPPVPAWHSSVSRAIGQAPPVKEASKSVRPVVSDGTAQLAHVCGFRRDLHG